MSEAMITPVVMCGGSGTRLWPLSRKSYPKQFSALLPGGSLFEQTLDRLAGATYAAPVLMTAAEFRFIVAEQRDLAGAGGRIVIEPEGRNTAPAVCAAALIAAEETPDGLMLVLPSDHVIAQPDAFHAAVTAGAESARAGEVVTFGIVPDRPETGYGYIELNAAMDPAAPPAALPFARFVEKPDADRAGQMVASGKHLWNSGMFLFRIDAMLDLFKAHAPEVLAACKAALAAGQTDLDFLRLGAEDWAACPDISIDYAIMEHVAGRVVPVDCGWNDLGSWATVWREMDRDGAENALSGPAAAIDCEGTLLRAEDPGQRLVGLGLKDVVAVAMRDAVLVTTKDRAQDVRLAVDTLKGAGAAEATDFPRVYRPWGWYETLALGPRFQVKQIMVKQGGILSLQSHHHRAEHWVVVAGTARVTVDEDVRLLTENQSVYIPLGAVHRLENPGKVELHLIEVQSGAYLGEDDILRYEDIYARS